jgi:uncharacterized membrane-anchored protein YitT (DUF2179 family)
VRSERALRIAVRLVGLIYLCLLYPLYRDLAHSRWLLVMQNEVDPMFLSWFIALGPFLLLAARKPSSHRLLIAFAGWQALAHAAVMSIQTVQAWEHGVHRNFVDVFIYIIIGGTLLTLLSATREQSAAASRASA